MTKDEWIKLCKDMAVALAWVKFRSDETSIQHKVAKEALDKYFSKTSDSAYLKEVEEAEALQ